MASETDHPLVQLRALVGVTQEALAAVAGVGRSTVAVIEANGTTPSRRTVRRLGSAFSLGEEAMASVLSGRTPVPSVAKFVTWKGTTSPMSQPLVVTVGDRENEAIDAARAISAAIADGFRRNNATLDELDTVRRWVNSLGPVVELAPELTDGSGGQSAEQKKIIDMLFYEARTEPRSHGGPALLSIVTSILAQLEWGVPPADPYEFTPRRVRRS